MRIAVLGATGKVGSLLVEQAVERGHHVVALVRAPERLTSVQARQVDVREHADLPVTDADVVISTLGISKGDGPGTLVAGARALAATNRRTITLGALGSGASTRAGGLLYQGIMRLFVGGELAEKAEADQIALDAGATVFHAPDLGNGPASADRRAVPLAELRRPLLPIRVSRATVAALLLDEAEGPLRGGILVPLG